MHRGIRLPRTLIRARASSLRPAAVASCCHSDGREQKRRDCVAVRSSPAGRVGRCWSLPGEGAAVWLLSFSIMEPGARDLHGWSRWPAPSPACCCPVIAPVAEGGRGIRLPTFQKSWHGRARCPCCFASCLPCVRKGAGGVSLSILSAGTCARGAAVSWSAALSLSGSVAKVPAMAETCALCGGQLTECVASLDRRRQVHG